MAGHSPVLPSFVGYSRPIHATASESSLSPALSDRHLSSIPEAVAAGDEPGEKDAPSLAPRSYADLGAPCDSSLSLASCVPGLLAALWLAYVVARGTPRSTQDMDEEWCLLAVLPIQAIPIDFGYYVASAAALLLRAAVNRLRRVPSSLIAMARAPFDPKSRVRALLRGVKRDSFLGRFFELARHYALYVALYVTMADVAPPGLFQRLAVSVLQGVFGGAVWALLPPLRTVDPVRAACAAAVATIPSHSHQLLVMLALAV